MKLYWKYFVLLILILQISLKTICATSISGSQNVWSFVLESSITQERYYKYCQVLPSCIRPNANDNMEKVILSLDQCSHRIFFCFSLLVVFITIWSHAGMFMHQLDLEMLIYNHLYNFRKPVGFIFYLVKMFGFSFSLRRSTDATRCLVPVKYVIKSQLRDNERAWKSSQPQKGSSCCQLLVVAHELNGLWKYHFKLEKKKLGNNKYKHKPVFSVCLMLLWCH